MYLLAMVLIALSVALFAVETVLYLAYVKFYYRLGPALIRHQWQSAAERQAMIEAIDRARGALKLGSRRRGDGFLLRFRWWELSIWSRVTLRVDQSLHGAMVIYEVRPFISPAFVALSVLMLAGIGRFQLFSIGYFLVIVLMYAAGLWWELRRLKSLEPMRTQLRALGLAICTRCGYDRFSLGDDAKCPECGHAP